jgi:hypothetical protein
MIRVYYTAEMMALEMGRKAWTNKFSLYENPYHHSLQEVMFRAWNSGWYDMLLRYELSCRGHSLPPSSLDYHPPSV